ncbi:MAG: hypothetical protein ABSC56_03795 [Solirubrobacteraceae bacterium]
MTSRLAALASRLGLSDEETLTIFKLDPLAAISGGYGPEVDILDGMTAEAAELAGAGALVSWVRSTVESPTPLELLERGDFAAFEDALERWLRDSGVLSG